MHCNVQKTMPKRRFIKEKRLSLFCFQTKWKCNVRSLKTFTLHESGTLKYCGYITKVLTVEKKFLNRKWKSVMKLTFFTNI